MNYNLFVHDEMTTQMCVEYLAAVMSSPIDINAFDLPLDDLERRRILRQMRRLVNEDKLHGNTLRLVNSSYNVNGII